MKRIEIIQGDNIEGRQYLSVIPSDGLTLCEVLGMLELAKAEFLEQVKRRTALAEYGKEEV